MNLRTTAARPAAAPAMGRRRHPLHRPVLGLLASLALAGHASAQCSGPDDGFEPNDTCATARPVTLPFIGRDLWVHRHDPDLFRFSVPAGRELRIDADFLDVDGDLDLVLYDAVTGCGDLWTNIKAARSNSNDEYLIWVNTGTVDRQVVLQVEMWRGSIPECNTYDLDIHIELPNEDCHPSLHDDALEPNDSCAAARPLPFGSTLDLWASRDDEDFYVHTVPAGATLDVTALFDHSRTDIDLFVYDATATCGFGYGTGELARSFSQDDDEHVVWTNASNSPRTVIVHIDVYVWHSCNDYALLASVSGTGVGTNFCNGVTNSTGLGGHMSARGTAQVSANGLVLEASQLPANTTGYFLCSRNRHPSSSGAAASGLCLGGDVGRFNAAVLSSGTAGRIELALNLGAVPQSSGNVSVVVNETWHFQAWYRDSSGGQATSRFTDGLTVLFQ